MSNWHALPIQTCNIREQSPNKQPGMKFINAILEGKKFILTLTIGCPETSPGDGALAVKMARDATKIKKEKNKRK